MGFVFMVLQVLTDQHAHLPARNGYRRLEHAWQEPAWLNGHIVGR